MTKILGLETSTTACAVGLWIDGDCRERFQIAERQHTKLILPMVDELLSEAAITLNQLDAIAFGCGPGMFTGIRIAAGIAQGLSVGCDKPIVSVSTLQCLAQAGHAKAPQHQLILPALDARMGQIYWGLYRIVDGLAESVTKDGIINPNQLGQHLADYHQPSLGVGSGWDCYQQQLSTQPHFEKTDYLLDLYPTGVAICQVASALYEQGIVNPPGVALPNYLRDGVTQN